MMIDKINKLKQKYEFGIVKFNIDLLKNKSIEEEKYNWVKSVIVFVFPYDNKSRQKDYLPAKLAYGNDYHRVVKTKIEEFLLEIGNIGKTEILVDQSFLDEKKIAVIAGLGIMGLNNLLISKNGTFVVIGEILSSYEFAKYDCFDFKTCVGCDKCVRACPTGALENGYDRSKCLSYINQSKTNRFDLLEKIETYYGCDICQDVCPYNNNLLKGTKELLFCEDSIITLEEILLIDESGFNSKYQGKSFHWIGYLKIIRNLLFLYLKKGLLTENHLKKAKEKNIRNEEWFNNTIDYLKRKINVN